MDTTPGGRTRMMSCKIQEYIDLCAPHKTLTIGHRYVIREKWDDQGSLKII